MGWSGAALTKWGFEMGEVVSIFLAERWVQEWESLSGELYLAGGPFGPGGEMVATLLELGPLEPNDETQRRVETLRAKFRPSVARARVLDYLMRRRGTRGW